jgi:hypothetical protein
MKYVLISAVVLVGCVLLVGPLADSIGMPDGVARVLDDVDGIF